jgi:hypothetical protein
MLAGLAVVGAVGATGVALESSAVARYGIRETGWELMPNWLVRVKRYYIVNAFPGQYRAHLTTCQVLGVSHWHGNPNFAKLDTEAHEDLILALHGKRTRLTNTTRFAEYDLLPTAPTD